MTTRRQFFVVLGSGLAIAPLAMWWTRAAGPADVARPASFPVQKTDEEWKRQLTTAQYNVLRRHHTERAFTSALNDEKRSGTFVCAGCGTPLFVSAAKYDSGTGWPSFWQPLPGAVGTSIDRSFLMVRTEVHCARCGGHLGHVFTDGPRPTGLRYCINGAALAFRPSPPSVTG